MLVRLSNRQRKDLLIDGFTLEIAVPLPAGVEIGPPAAFLRRALVDDGVADCVIDADIVEVPVATRLDHNSLDDTPPWGHIVDDRPHHRLTHYVVAAVVKLQKRQNPRGTKPLAWPKAISLDGGQTWLPQTAPAEVSSNP